MKNIKTRSVKIGNITIGGPEFVVMAGPCSLESEEHFRLTSKEVKKRGANILRGGIYKLRSRPESFQGLGASSFSYVKDIKKEVNLPFISEVTDPRQISDMLDIVDCFQVGSRNMYNYELLKELGATNKPILLKRGFSALIQEWISAAEYISQAGNNNVILCERGIRSFETATRNTFDINAIAYIKQNSNFPIIADPSHATGIRDLVIPMSLAATAAGADGLMVEVHPDPDKALSDGFQSLNFNQFSDLISQLNRILNAINKRLSINE